MSFNIDGLESVHPSDLFNCSFCLNEKNLFYSNFTPLWFICSFVGLDFANMHLNLESNLKPTGSGCPNLVTWKKSKKTFQFSNVLKMFWRVLLFPFWMGKPPKTNKTKQKCNNCNV